MNLDDYKEQTAQTYFELDKKPMTLRILDGVLEESTDGQQFIIKWQFEGAAPSQVVGKDGNTYDFANMPLSPWWYLPKSGRSKNKKTGKDQEDSRCAQFASLARKLGLPTAGLTIATLTQGFVDKFAGKAFVAEDFYGARKVKKQNGEPVMDDEGNPKTFIEYNFWRIKESAPSFNAK